MVYEKDIPRVYLSGAHLPITKDFQTMKMKYESKSETFECWITIKCQQQILKSLNPQTNTFTEENNPIILKSADKTHQPLETKQKLCR